MTNAEKEKLYNLGMGMADEEKKLILMTIPTQFLMAEIDRRKEIMEKEIKDVRSILVNKTRNSNMTFEEMQEAIKDIKEVLK